MILKARYIVPVDAPPIENGAVLIENGRIAVVGPARTLSGKPVTDYGDAVICPGFVNAHTHLELSRLAGRIPPTPDFIAWLRRVLQEKTNHPPTREGVNAAVREGLSQSIASGVTMIGDITRNPAWAREVFSGSVMRGVSFGEVIAIGSRRDMLTEYLEAAASVEHQTDSMRIGISPHAPYSVEPDAMRACALRAKDIGAPTCIHLLESADEELFTRTREGPFADYLRELGIWDDQIPASACTPVELAVRTGAVGPRTIIAHANYVSDDDIAQIASGGASVAYCPRTHKPFGHPPHRFRDMLAAGINVCIATDSLASNPSLSVLDELRFLRNLYPDFPADTLLAMGTLRGAQALGLSDVAGSITVGKPANLIVIPCDTHATASSWTRILESGRQPIEVFVGGVAQLHARDR
ncbi:MAG: amidohydrolase family protein [Planctomycetota bacterium]|jgi:cytosine/adenosine deaminase-related metal-dependent hydrolase